MEENTRRDDSQWDSMINKKSGYVTVPTIPSAGVHTLSFEFIEELAKRLKPSLDERRKAGVAEMEQMAE